MRKKYGKDDLVILPVSINSLKPEEGEKGSEKEWVTMTLQSVRRTLQEKGLTVPGVILDLRKEDENFLEEKLRFSSPPVVYVFSREGKWTQFKAEDYKTTEKMAEALDQCVDRLVKQKK